MKISIITACLNNEKTIAKTLESVARQTYSNIEHIIIDGESTDDTLNIVHNYPHVSKIISKKDKGIYFALNKGLEIATGEIVGFLHADDFLASNKVIEHIADFFIKNQKLDAIYGNLQYVSNNDKNKIIRNWIAGEFHIENLSKGWMPPHPTFYVKKEIYDKLGNFNTNYKISADYDLMLRFLTAGIKTEYLREIIVKMRWGGASNKNLRQIFLKSKEDLDIIRKNKIGGINVLLYKNFSKINQFIK